MQGQNKVQFTPEEQKIEKERQLKKAVSGKIQGIIEIIDPFVIDNSKTKKSNHLEEFYKALETFKTKLEDFATYLLSDTKEKNYLLNISKKIKDINDFCILNLTAIFKVLPDPYQKKDKLLIEAYKLVKEIQEKIDFIEKFYKKRTFDAFYKFDLLENLQIINMDFPDEFDYTEKLKRLLCAPTIEYADFFSSLDNAINELKNSSKQNLCDRYRKFRKLAREKHHFVANTSSFNHDEESIALVKLSPSTPYLKIIQQEESENKIPQLPLSPSISSGNSESSLSSYSEETTKYVSYSYLINDKSISSQKMQSNEKLSINELNNKIFASLKNLCDEAENLGINFPIGMHQLMFTLYNLTPRSNPHKSRPTQEFDQASQKMIDEFEKIISNALCIYTSKNPEIYYKLTICSTKYFKAIHEALAEKKQLNEQIAHQAQSQSPSKTKKHVEVKNSSYSQSPSSPLKLTSPPKQQDKCRNTIPLLPLSPTPFKPIRSYIPKNKLKVAQAILPPSPNTYILFHAQIKTKEEPDQKSSLNINEVAEKLVEIDLTK